MTIPTSVPHLLALATGKDCIGTHRCWYCAAPCGEVFPTARYVKDSFTGRTGVAAPGSPWVCQGCVLCLREDARIAMLAGKRRDGQRMRSYSWVLTAGSARAATKAHLVEHRAICIAPPPPPFALVLSDSGQTHQFYRGVVNHASDPTVVTLEGERIAYRRHELTTLLRLAARISAVAGKVMLREPMAPMVAIRVIEAYIDGESLVAAWEKAWSTGPGRLAAWLAPSKADAQQEYQPDVRGQETEGGARDETKRGAGAASHPRA